MAARAITHLNFRGTARHALAFYQSVFGSNLTIVTYQDLGEVQDPAETDQVAWGLVAATSGFRIMAYDVQARKAWNQGENAFYVALRVETVDEITAYWEKLAAGATIVQELAPAPWGAMYGMLTDQFGVTWVMDVVTPWGDA